MAAAAMAERATSFFDVLRHFSVGASGRVIAAIDGVAMAGGAAGREPPRTPSQLTYAELCDHAEGLAGLIAAELRSMEGRSGEGCGANTLATAMKRGNDWYCVFWAAVRLQVPIVGLSRDLPEQEIEQRRNEEILLTHRPRLLIVDDVTLEELSAWTTALPTVTTRYFGDLWERLRAAGRPPKVPAFRASPDAVLCYCYTGGTTKASRCARVTHGMALHEVRGYPKVVPSMGHQDRVLQQHSVYWAASAYGEVDIALAFGCALVFMEAWDAEAVVSAIRSHKATCAGLVPSVLAAIDHSQVPSLRCVFTWGEALQPRVAREWARTLRHLIDLLISTECWLSLYADWNKDSQETPLFQTVPGVQVRLRPVLQEGDLPDDEVPPQGKNANDASAGELLVAGPMVSPGYTESHFTALAFDVDASGRRWYCTKDCLERVGGKHGRHGYRFAGRADELVKVGGVWVDTRDLERTLLGLAGVSAVCICRRDAYVVLGGILPDGLLTRIRTRLPPDFALFLVPSLPRCAGTGKVDRRRLALLVGWSNAGMKHQELEDSRANAEIASMVRWYRPLLLPFLASLSWALRSELVESRASGSSCLNAVHFGRILGGEFIPYTCSASSSSPGVAAEAISFISGFAARSAFEVAWRFLCLSYLILPIWYAPSKCGPCFFSFPLGMYGFALFLCSVLPDYRLGILAAIPGLTLAFRRNRVLSWPCVCFLGFPVWCREANHWMKANNGRQIFRWYLYQTYSNCGWYSRQCARRLRRSFSLLTGIPAVGVELGLQRLSRFGLVNQCGWCSFRTFYWKGQLEPPSAGQPPHPPAWRRLLFWRRQTPVALVESPRGARPPRWYCNKCWLEYNKHVQCKFCCRWTVEARRNEDAVTWSCLRCLAEQPSTPRGAAAAAGRPETSEEASLREARALATLFAEKVKRRTIKVRPPAAASPITNGHDGHDREAANGGAKRAAEGEAPEAPPPLRRRSSSGAKSGLEDSADVDAEEGTTASSPSPSRSPKAKRARLAGESGEDTPNGVASNGVSSRASPVVKSKEWSIIERSTGVDFESLSDSLLGLDSLRRTKLTGALRREAGKLLSREILKNLGTLGDLLEKLQSLPDESIAQTEHKQDVHIKREYAAWGMMWTSKCQWYFRASRALPPAEVKLALERLIERHPALRAQLVDPYDLFGATQKALTALLLWRSHGPEVGWFLRALANAANTAARWSLWRTWPRVIARERGSQELNLKVMEHSDSFEDAEWRLQGDYRHFKPPFYAVLAPFGSGDSEGAILHIFVTHMLSDGYAVVPLLDDLSALLPDIADGMQADAAATKLPPLPSPFAPIEQRLHRTIESTKLGGITDNALLPRITPESPSGFPRKRQAVMVYAGLEPDLVNTIRRSAKMLAVPDDIALLTVIGVTLAWFLERPSEPISMIVPQRDGPSEPDMVALLADNRIFEVRTEGLSFAGVALRLHHIIKERLWQVPDPMTQFEPTQVNFEWTDFQTRRGGLVQHVPYLRENIEQSFIPLRVAVDQPGPDRWRCRVAFMEERYTDADIDRFFRIFEHTIAMLRDNPLELAWPPASLDDGDQVMT